MRPATDPFERVAAHLDLNQEARDLILTRQDIELLPPRPWIWTGNAKHAVRIPDGVTTAQRVLYSTLVRPLKRYEQLRRIEATQNRDIHPNCFRTVATGYMGQLLALEDDGASLDPASEMEALCEDLEDLAAISNDLYEHDWLFEDYTISQINEALTKTGLASKWGYIK